MTSTEISRASTKHLIARESLLLNHRHESVLEAFADSTWDARWDEIDAIRDELSERAHDLEDPSSGLLGTGNGD